MGGPALDFCTGNQLGYFFLRGLLKPGFQEHIAYPILPSVGRVSNGLRDLTDRLAGFVERDDLRHI